MKAERGDKAEEIEILWGLSSRFLILKRHGVIQWHYFLPSKQCPSLKMCSLFCLEPLSGRPQKYSFLPSGHCHHEFPSNLLLSQLCLVFPTSSPAHLPSPLPEALLLLPFFLFHCSSLNIIAISLVLPPPLLSGSRIPEPWPFSLLTQHTMTFQFKCASLFSVRQQTQRETISVHSWISRSQLYVWTGDVLNNIASSSFSFSPNSSKVTFPFILQRSYMAVGLSLRGWHHRDASFLFLNNKVTPSHGRFGRGSPGPVKQSWGEEWLQKVRLGSGGSWYRTCLPRSCKSLQKHGWWELKCEAVTPVTLPQSHCPRVGGQGEEPWPWAPSLAVLSPRLRQLTGEWQLRKKELKDKGEEIGS